MGRNLTQQEIDEASLAMESQMELHELQESLKELRDNLEYLRTHAKRIALPTYLKIKAAEQAASSAIQRIIGSGRPHGQQVPEKPKKDPVRGLRLRKGVGKPSKERSRACLRVVRSRR